MLLKYKNINVHYTDSGKGPALVFLHGFLENSKIWEPFITTLSQKNRVICVDLLGHGQTDCLGYIHTMDAMAEAVLTVLKHLRIRKFVLFGHSMGGYVALSIAEKNPHHIKGLGLINSTSKADSEERKQNRDRAIKAVKENHKLFINVSIPNLFGEENREKFAKEIEFLKSEALKIPVQGIIAALEGMKTRPDRESILHSSIYKKMLIIGKKDPVLSFEDSLKQVENTDVNLVEFPDGHMSFIENEGLFLHKIMHFIENK